MIYTPTMIDTQLPRKNIFGDKLVHLLHLFLEHLNLVICTQWFEKMHGLKFT